MSIHFGWAEEVMGAPWPAEPIATCDRCVMCADDPDPRVVRFDPSTRCCTFLPEVPNFLVGAILADEAPDMADGKRRIERRIEARLGITPLGIGRTVTEQASHAPANTIEAFGRAPSLRCPYYASDRGGCGIWRHRPGVCATWFCKYQRGATAQRFWSRLRNVLATVEHTVARWCMVQVGLDADALSRLFPAVGLPGAVVVPAEGATMPALWGEWHGRERELYLACADHAARLGWHEARVLGGVELQLRERLLVEAAAAMRALDVPARLRPRPYRVLRMSDEVTRAETYNEFDPVELPTQVVDVLHRFDGREVSEVVQEIVRDYGVLLEPDLIRTLCDFELLEPVG